MQTGMDKSDIRHPTSDIINILIVDDHPVVRDGLSAILSTQTDFHIAGEAASGVDALALVAEAPPDVLLLDLEMPGMDGIEVLQHLRGTYPDVKTIVFTAFDTDERILNALRAGARGYLLKGAPRSELFEAVRVVHSGASLLHPVVASRLLNQIASPTQVEELTPREHEVLLLLAQGKQNKEIARELAITERTVKFHISAILGKLDAGNRTEAVTIAVQRGLIEL